MGVLCHSVNGDSATAFAEICNGSLVATLLSVAASIPGDRNLVIARDLDRYLLALVEQLQGSSSSCCCCY